MRFGIFLICQFIWTIFPLTFQSPDLGEIARDTVTNDVPKKVNLDKDLLAILCCPETKQAVVLADDVLIQKVNGAIERGALKNKAEKLVTEKLDGGLIRSDNQILYPVREDIPVMLIDEGIPLAQIS
jgi:uncharacterized protein YbaR (Trm112 family)